MIFRCFIFLLCCFLLQSCMNKGNIQAQKIKDAAILETYGYYCMCKKDALSENIVLEFEKNDTLRKEVIYHSYIPTYQTKELISWSCPYELHIVYDTVGDSIKYIEKDGDMSYASFLKNSIMSSKFRTAVKKTPHLHPDLQRILKETRPK
jgi:hypothetical protein